MDEGLEKALYLCAVYIANASRGRGMSYPEMVAESNALFNAVRQDGNQTNWRCQDSRYQQYKQRVAYADEHTNLVDLAYIFTGKGRDRKALNESRCEGCVHSDECPVLKVLPKELIDVCLMRSDRPKLKRQEEVVGDDASMFTMEGKYEPSVKADTDITTNKGDE